MDVERANHGLPFLQYNPANHDSRVIGLAPMYPNTNLFLRRLLCLTQSSVKRQYARDGRHRTHCFMTEIHPAKHHNMDAFKEDPDKLLPPLLAHLSAVESSPTLTLDADLLKRGERSLDFSTPQSKLLQVLGSGERLLPHLQQDPTPLTRLIERAVSLIPFEVLQPLIPADKLEDGLQSPLVVTQPVSPVQLLCLTYLMRATQTPSGAAFVATNEPLSRCLFEVWLLDENTEVADRALEVIVALLTVDHPKSNTLIGDGMAHGQGLFWRRVFHDRALYTFIFEATRGKETPRDVQGLRTAKQRQGMPGITQARLFDFISRVAALDWAPMTTTTFRDFEEAYLWTHSIRGWWVVMLCCSAHDRQE